MEWAPNVVRFYVDGVGLSVIFDVTLLSTAPAPANAAQGDSGSPFSVWTQGRQQGAMLTLHP